MKNFTDIICILDRSGSMNSIQNDAIGGFNSFLKEQKEIEGDARITMVLFDHEYQLLYKNIDIRGAELLTNRHMYLGVRRRCMMLLEKP